MGLETVLKDIQQRGDEEVERIRREGKEEAERLLREAHSKRKALVEASQGEALKAAARLRTQESSRVELETKRAHLIMEKDMLDLVLSKARQRLAAFPPEKDRDLLRRLLLKNGSKAAIVITSKRSEGTVKSLAPGLQFGGAIDCIGGIILQTTDGSVRYDFRYETLLEQAAQASIREVSRILFQGEK